MAEKADVPISAGESRMFFQHRRILDVIQVRIGNYRTVQFNGDLATTRGDFLSSEGVETSGAAVATAPSAAPFSATPAGAGQRQLAAIRHRQHQWVCQPYRFAMPGVFAARP